MSVSIQAIADALIHYISSAPNQQILGARLGAQLRAGFPEFSPADFQSRNLRQLIRSYIPAIVEKGRSGPDLIYGLASDQLNAASSDLSVQGAPVFARGSQRVSGFDWKAFSNPTYRFNLAVNPDTEEFRLVAGSEISPPWVILPKPTSAEHHGIAKAFAETLDEEPRSQLEKLLLEPKWFVTFSSVTKRLGVGSSWAAFRTARLKKKFAEELSALGVATRLEPASAAPPNPLATAAVGPNVVQAARSSEDRLRRLVSLVVAELPLSDLRALNLPVGAVFDHIKEIQG